MCQVSAATRLLARAPFAEAINAVGCCFCASGLREQLQEVLPTLSPTKSTKPVCVVKVLSKVRHAFTRIFSPPLLFVLQRTPKAIRLCNNSLHDLSGVAECFAENIDISSV